MGSYLDILVEAMCYMKGLVRLKHKSVKDFSCLYI